MFNIVLPVVSKGGTRNFFARRQLSLAIILGLNAMFLSSAAQAETPFVGENGISQIVYADRIFKDSINNTKPANEGFRSISSNELTRSKDFTEWSSTLASPIASAFFDKRATSAFSMKEKESRQGSLFISGAAVYDGYHDKSIFQGKGTGLIEGDYYFVCTDGLFVDSVTYSGTAPLIYTHRGYVESPLIKIENLKIAGDPQTSLAIFETSGIVKTSITTKDNGRIIIQNISGVANTVKGIYADTESKIYASEILISNIETDSKYVVGIEGNFEFLNKDANDRDSKMDSLTVEKINVVKKHSGDFLGVSLFSTDDPSTDFISKVKIQDIYSSSGAAGGLRLRSTDFKTNSLEVFNITAEGADGKAFGVCVDNSKLTAESVNINNISAQNQFAVFASGKNSHVKFNAENPHADSVVNIVGNIQADKGAVIDINLLNSQSGITGAIIETSSDSNPKGKVNLKLADGGFWKLNTSASLTGNVVLNEGGLIYLYEDENNPDGTTLQLDNLTHTTEKGGHIILHGAHLDESSLASRVIVREAKGDHKLFILPDGRELYSAKKSLLQNTERTQVEYETPYVLKVQKGDSFFELGNQGGTVALGVYNYVLAERPIPEGNKVSKEEIKSEAKEYYLVRVDHLDDTDGEVVPDTNNPDKPEDTKPENKPENGDNNAGTGGSNSSSGTKPLYSPTAEAMLAMAGLGAQSSQYLSQLSDLRKRIGEVRYLGDTGIWASVGGSKDRINGFSGTTFRQDSYRFNFGADHRIGDWILGANIKISTSDQKTKDTNYRADGRLNSQGLNLYATWINEAGTYVDIIASVDRFHQKINSAMKDSQSARASYNSIGFGLSSEIGHKFSFGETKEFFAEPQLEISYYHAKGENFKTSNSMEVKQKNYNSVTARVGGVFGKDFYSPEGKYTGQVYGRLGMKQELAGKQKIELNKIKFEDKLAGTRVYYGVGAELGVTKNLHVFGHVEREHGAHFSKEIEASIGLKYRF